MQRLQAGSKDILQDNIDKIKNIFPEVFTEDKINFERLKLLLGEYVDENDELYSFNWNGKKKCQILAQTPSMGTLRPYKEESVNWDNTENLFIEGDNLEVLKILQKSYFEKVKIIYIDPPYNRENGDDLIYKDDFSDNIKNYKLITGQTNNKNNSISNEIETTGRYHTHWLNMIYPRLKLAKNLLKKDGVIFISIDDNELTNLKFVCDEIFGQNNLLANLVWKKKYTGGKHTNGYVDMHEYILVYAKSKKDMKTIQIKRPDEEKAKFTETDEFELERGKFYVRPLKSNLGLRKTLIYPIVAPDGSVLNNQWIVSEKTYKKLLEEKRIVFRLKKNKKYQIYKKYYENDGEGFVKPPSLIEKFPNTEGKFELKKLFNIKEGRDNVFYTVKPLNLIKHLIEAHDDSNAIILDFFAGSGTTAHSVLSLNKDTGNRKFILVQMKEKIKTNSNYSYISDITKDRISKTIKLFENESNFSNNLGFKVFKLDSSNIKSWDSDYNNFDESQLDFMTNNIKEDRTDYDLLYEILLKYGLDLSMKIKEYKIDNKIIYSIGRGALIVCLENNIKHNIADKIIQIKRELTPEICRVVFKDTGFDSDVDKTNTLQILKQHNINDVRSI